MRASMTLRIEPAGHRARQGTEDAQVASPSTNLGWRGGVRGIRPCHRRFSRAKAESRGSDGQVVVQFIPQEFVPERRDSRIREEPPAVRSKAVRGVRRSTASRETDEDRKSTRLN